jgi:hypothetical protein
MYWTCDGLEFNQLDGSGELHGTVERKPCAAFGDFVGDGGVVCCV